jgi:spermidine synthase
MANTTTSRANTLILLGVVACFILSGFAALLYQTAWMRQFSLVFGTSELAIAAVLSAYMGGLSLGAMLAAKFVHRITRPVLFYGLLEAGIAISALAVPLLLHLARILYVAILGGQPEPVDASGLGQSFFYLIIAFIVLSIPTTFMGATLPLLTKYVVQTKEQIGSRVGLLYATNTLGAIGGTVVAGFVLLPLLGLNGTVWVGVAINLLVFFLAAAIARAIGDHAKLHPEEAPSEDSLGESLEASSAPRARLWILPLMLLSGANSFVYEVLWTRLLGHILGGSITAFATMLAGFLSGIAIGSAIASRFAKTREQAIYLFVGVQCGIALTSILIYQLLPLAIPDTAGLSGNVLFAIMVLLPATIFIGATFPLAVRILAADKTDAAPASAKVYSWNTVGAILGATLAAFFLIPLLKYEGAIKVAVLLNALLALCAAALLGNRNKAVTLSVLTFTLAVIFVYQPKMPESILRSSPVFAQPNGEIRFYEVGRSATVLVIEESGYLNLRTNGLPEASTSLKGAPPYIHNQRMLSTMPVLARPDTDSMLIVGLGAGVALEGVPASVSEIDVIEIESEVVKANQYYGDERAINPLDDPRFNITVNDARSALTLTDKKYDAIVSQPSHPWTAGASHLYTREFMALAKDHLTEDGVYLQWMNSQFVDEFLLRSLCATMLDVYPYVRVYQWNTEVLFFLGSNSPMDVETQIATTGRPLNDDPLGYLEMGVGSVEDVIAALAMDQPNVEAFAEGGSIITDNSNYMATRSARVMNTQDALRSSKLYGLLAGHDPLLDSNSWLRSGFPVQVNYPYISKRLERLTMKQRAVDLASSLLDSIDPQALVMIALGQERQGEREEAQKNLRLALQADPYDQQARYALLLPWFDAYRRGEEIPDYVLEQFLLLEGTARDTLTAWLAANNQEMLEVVELDSELASVDPSDLWYETSVKLRSDWRIKVTTPEYQPRLANEATALIDSAIVFSQDTQFYSMRMQSTLLADDVVSAVETARRLLERIGQDLDVLESSGEEVAAGAAAFRASQVRQIAELVDVVQDDSRLPSYKIETLTESLEDVTNRVEELVGTL